MATIEQYEERFGIVRPGSECHEDDRGEVWMLSRRLDDGDFDALVSAARSKGLTPSDILSATILPSGVQLERRLWG